MAPYIYLNTYYSKVANESAILLSPSFISNSICLTFWYLMYADNTAIIGSLSVYKTDISSTESMTLLWTRSGKQSQNKTNWIQASINVTVSSSGSRLIFIAQRYYSYMGDIGKCKLFFKN